MYYNTQQQWVMGFRFAAERERSSAGRARTKAQAETIGVRRLPENSSGVLKITRQIATRQIKICLQTLK